MATDKLKYKSDDPKRHFSFYGHDRLGPLARERIAAKQCTQFLWIPIGIAYDYTGEPFENKAVVLIYLN